MEKISLDEIHVLLKKAYDMNNNVKEYFLELPNNEFLYYIRGYVYKFKELTIEYDSTLMTLSHNINSHIKKRVYRKFIKKHISLILKNNHKILKLTSNPIRNKNEISLLLELNNKSLIILKNMIDSYSDYKYSIKDISSLKKLDFKNLEFGDIVLSQKSKDIIKQQFFLRLVYFVTKSDVEHATIFYERKGKNYYFIDVSNDYSIKKKTQYIKCKKNYSKDNLGLVLRYKKGLNRKEKKLMHDYLDNNIGKYYASFKTLFVGSILLFNTIMPYFNIRVYPMKTDTYFCSENVVKAYEYAGIYLGILNEDSFITPVDLLNSPELEIIGYIDHSQQNC